MDYKERLKAVELFLNELGRGIPEDERVMVGYASEATVQTDASGKKLNAGWWPAPHRDGKNIKTEDNCYVCISSSKKTPNPKTGELRYWRGDESFGHGLALMVDDIGTGRGSKGLLHLDQFTARLEPTAVVETSPGNHQLWYFLDAPEPSRKRFKAFLVGFVSTVLVDKGGDGTIRDISRYGRMPAGINNKRDKENELKYADERGKPFRVGLAGEPRYDRRYSMDAIASAFGFRIDDFLPAEVKLTPEQIANRDVDMEYDVIWREYAIHILSAAKQGEGSGGDVSQNMSGKYRIRCPWGDEHTNGDSYGAYFRGPIPGAEYEHVFGCGHDTCRKEKKRTWSPFIDKVVMPAIIEAIENNNRRYADGDMANVEVTEFKEHK